MLCFRFVEMLQCHHKLVVKALQILYKHCVNKDGFPGEPLVEVPGGYPLTHAILDRLGLIKQAEEKNGDGLDQDTTESFEFKHDPTLYEASPSGDNSSSTDPGQDQSPNPNLLPSPLKEQPKSIPDSPYGKPLEDDDDNNNDESSLQYPVGYDSPTSTSTSCTMVSSPSFMESDYVGYDSPTSTTSTMGCCSPSFMEPGLAMYGVPCPEHSLPISIYQQPCSYIPHDNLLDLQAQDGIIPRQDYQHQQINNSWWPCVMYGL